MRTTVKNEHRRVSIATHKTMRRKKTAEVMKPSSRSLFQTIESLLKFADIMGKIRKSETLRLFHVHFFSEMSIQECILDILLNGPMRGDS